MRQAFLLASFAALAAGSPAAQAINFASVDAAPSPSLTGPAPGMNTQDVPYNSASVSAEGSAAATGVASASASASQIGNSKRGWVQSWGWQWGSQPQPSPSTSQPSWQPPTTKSPQWGQPTGKPQSPPWTSSSEDNWNTATSTTSQIYTSTSTTSSETACATTPEAGTYCGFINPEDPCAPQPDGYGPHVEPDTADAFEAYPEFHKEAQEAQAPSGYVATFKDLNVSVSTNTYLGLETLKSYDVEECAEYCNNKTLCTGFNIFFERDPSLNPSDNCTQPASITNYKCTLWGSSVGTASATNYGDYRGQFQVVIAGSDGFEKTNTTTSTECPGWQPPQHCPGDGSNAHHHPSTCIGNYFFPGPYDPNLCSAYAQAQNSVNQESPFWVKWVQYFTESYNPLKCDFFNSYMLKKNGHPLGTYCAIFSQSYEVGEATYTAGWQGSDYWSIESSWSYSIDVEYEGYSSSSWW